MFEHHISTPKQSRAGPGWLKASSTDSDPHPHIPVRKALYGARDPATQDPGLVRDEKARPEAMRGKEEMSHLKPKKS